VREKLRGRRFSRADRRAKERVFIERLKRESSQILIPKANIFIQIARAIIDIHAIHEHCNIG